MAKRIRCPNILCKSTDVVPVSTKAKFSLRKAVIDGTVGSLFAPPWNSYWCSKRH